MIGCGNYTETIACLQYVNNVQNMKISMLAILIILSILVIYYCRTKHYRQVVSEFQSVKTFLLVPRWLAYTFLAFSFYFPFLLSITVPIEDFMRFIYAFVIPVVAWMSMLSFLLFIDWVFQRLGFENFKHFVNSAWKKR